MTLLYYKAFFKNGSNMLWFKSRRKVDANIVLLVIILLFVIVMVGNMTMRTLKPLLLMLNFLFLVWSTH